MQENQELKELCLKWMNEKEFYGTNYLRADKNYKLLDDEPTFKQTETIIKKAKDHNKKLESKINSLKAELIKLEKAQNKNLETIETGEDILYWIERIANATESNKYANKKTLSRMHNKYIENTRTDPEWIPL